jgi:hypothetical protein
LGHGGLIATHERDSKRREESDTAQSISGTKKILLRQRPAYHLTHGVSILGRGAMSACQ